MPYNSNSVVGASRHSTRLGAKCCFTNFPLLPPELRHMIWVFALEELAPGRFIVFDVYTQRIIPTAGLVSPMLLVSRESRHLALNYYALRIPVYEITRRTSMQIPLYTANRDDLNLTVSEHGKERGCLYLNTLQDPIILGVRYVDFKEPDKSSKEKPYYAYTTEKMGPDNFDISPRHVLRVRNLWCRLVYSQTGGLYKSQGPWVEYRPEPLWLREVSTLRGAIPIPARVLLGSYGPRRLSLDYSGTVYRISH
ncbi:hypothetical protein PG997_008560 [Apiospora hydei]|uniref:2EXR domain-containing protein n=1 Tax=Apiospora hydei TaxID=1337664 RepID=A0ABR1WBE6_9PEZI